MHCPRPPICCPPGIPHINVAYYHVLLYLQATLSETLHTLEELLLQPFYTLPLGGCLRGALLRVVSHITEHAYTSVRVNDTGYHASLAVALVHLLDLSPHLGRQVYNVIWPGAPAYLYICTHGDQECACARCVAEDYVLIACYCMR